MKLRSYLGRIRRKYNNGKILRNDASKFKKYSAESNLANDNGNSAERSILIQSHVIEKGLSHKSLKPLFGYKRVSTIASSLKDYLKKGGKDPYVIGTAISALETYNGINRTFDGVSELDLFPVPEVKGQCRDILVGAEEISREKFFKASDIRFSELCKARHSLRMYDCESKKISYEDILQCIELAQICPNACNRQAVRVKIVLDSVKIKQISKIQGGAEGFGENSGAMLLITSDISLYTMGEHNLAMLDCGIFIMNLVYALYEKELGSCILNCCMTEKDEASLKKLVPVSDSEVFAAIISVSDIPENESVKITKSDRRDVEAIVQLI